jgi:L-ascorbate metabolism protein UlaG (beta-lactamase superfamily)
MIDAAQIRATRAGDGHFSLWWLGQSGFLLQWGDRHIVLDPYLSDSLTAKYADTTRPHIRVAPRVIDPERLDFIDIVTASHGHTDHLDPETLRPLARVNPGLALVVPEAVRALARERSGLHDAAIVGLRDGASVTLGEFRITAIPSAHERLETDMYLGYVIRFGPWTVYHSGDTVPYGGLAELLEPFAINVAMLPINGRSPERGVPGNLTAEEAVWLAKRAGIRTVIPCHYGMFAFNTGDPDKFARLARDAGQNATVVCCGERWESSRA